MMKRIVILDENTSNQIAAGEVVERPVSIVKELIENSVDAGARNIHVDISRGGLSLIRVLDDGGGIHPDDIEMALERHGTSKIRHADDLKTVRTLGFRGEALPSIASVSRLEIDTRTKESDYGVRISMSGGNFEDKAVSSREPGTTVSVRDLFFNVPARYKFLKSDSTETRYCTDMVTRMALAHPDISFRYTSDRKELLRTPGDGDLKNALYCAYGREIISNLYPVEYRDETCTITGFVGNRFTSRGNRQNQTVFVNGRYVRDRTVTKAVEKAYETEIMKGKFPFYVLNLDIDTALVDVNVHPAKTEVRFQRSGEIFNSFYSAVRSALDSSRGITPGGETNARIHRKSFVNDPEPFETPTFFEKGNGGPRNERIPPAVHESFVKAKEEFQNKYKSDDINFNEPEPVYGKAGTKYIDAIRESRIAGVVFNTFIILEYSADEMLVIDQHAAHERITYERIMKEMKEGSVISQKLIAPHRVRTGRNNMTVAEEKRNLIESVGFEFDPIGPDEIAVRSIPAQISGENTADVFLGVLDYLSSSETDDIRLAESETVYRMACRNSVKANTRLSEKEIKSLLEQLYGLENPYTCPHGRPVVLSLSRRELEKIFKRIV